MRAESGAGANPLRLAIGLIRFGSALAGAVLRLAVGSAGRPDPIHLQPRVLQGSGSVADDDHSP